MNYYKISITTAVEKKEIIIALLNHIGFDGFEEDDFGFKTYISEDSYKESVLQELANQFDFSYKTKLIPQQNWNAVWEANFQPIQIDDFCAIRADFHPSFSSVTHEITINPKMAFGTGHHETTMSMMEIMRTLDFKDKIVFDYGCGTGILAILAAKMGAQSVLAIDYDPLSYENTIENCKKNEIKIVKTLLGELPEVDNALYFDIILANINKNVILNSLPSLFLKTKQNGHLLISGVLHTDVDLLRSIVEKIGFSILKVIKKGDWICMHTTKL